MYIRKLCGCSTSVVAGHGGQVHDLNNDESDGWDEGKNVLLQIVYIDSE